MSHPRDGRRTISSSDPNVLFGADFYSGDLEKTAANYLRAASFVRFFIDEYGLETMLHVYREVAHDADVSVIDGALRSITGFPLADVLKAWAARGPVGTAEYCLWPEARLFKSLPAGSDEAAVLDPTPRVAHGLDFTNETSFGLQRVLSVPKSGFHRVAVDATADLSISLLPSEGGMVGFLDMKTGNNVSTEAIVDLAAGAYWLDTVGWSAASAHLFWEPTPAGLSTTCGEGAAIPLPTGISTRLITWRPPAQACDGKTCRGWLALAAAVDTTVFLAPSPESPEPGADFNLVCESSCNVCVPAASRVAAKAGGTTYVQWELKLGPSSPIPHGTPVRLLLSATSLE